MNQQFSNSKIVWKPVSEFPEYLVSSNGEIQRNGRKLKPTANGKSIQFHRNGKSCTRSIARVVLEAFSRGPLPGEEAVHLDGNIQNNSLANVMWMSHSFCQCYHIEKGHIRTKCPYDEMEVIRDLCEKGDGYYGEANLARSYGLSDTYIRDIVNGRCGNHQVSRLVRIEQSLKSVEEKKAS